MDDLTGKRPNRGLLGVISFVRVCRQHTIISNCLLINPLPGWSCAIRICQNLVPRSGPPFVRAGQRLHHSAHHLAGSLFAVSCDLWRRMKAGSWWLRDEVSVDTSEQHITSAWISTKTGGQIWSCLMIGCPKAQLLGWSFGGDGPIER